MSASSTPESSAVRRTALYDEHVAAGGKLVDFAGWQLPIHYGSQIDEHHAVRQRAGVFDVSHMTVVDLAGAQVHGWLQRLLTNDVARLSDGQALYSCMCRPDGGVIDDLIVYRLSAERYRMVVNAATRDKDIAWLEAQREGDVVLSYPDDLAMLAVQGPQARAAVAAAIGTLEDDFPGSVANLADIKRFSAQACGNWFVARTGYTGEDGYEITMPNSQAPTVWRALLAAGVSPAGLGARDTLRLEAGMSLYGNDLDEQHSPVESGIAWTVDLRDAERDFIGREVLEDQKSFGGRSQQVGLVLEGRGVLRGHQRVQLAGQDVGEVTSGTFSPTLQCAIGMARVSKAIDGGCDVVIRDRPIAARVVPLPFLKNGKASF